MIGVILQPSYVPWRGVFDLIHRADVFVFYDDVQYDKYGWRNRNRVKTANGTTWLTIPTGSDLNRLVCEVSLPDMHWARKHWKTLEQAYSSAPHFRRYEPFLRISPTAQRWSRWRREDGPHRLRWQRGHQNRLRPSRILVRIVDPHTWHGRPSRR